MHGLKTFSLNTGLKVAAGGVKSIMVNVLDEEESDTSDSTDTSDDGENDDDSGGGRPRMPSWQHQAVASEKLWNPSIKEDEE